MAKISELSDGGSLQSTDFLIAVRSGGNVKVQADGNLSLGTVTANGLTVETGSGNTYPTASTSADNLVISDKTASTPVGITIFSDNASQGNIFFGDENDADNGRIVYDHNGNANTMSFYANGAERLSVDSTGIDVSGTVTADGLTVGASVPTISFQDTDGNTTHTIAGGGNGDLNISVDPTDTGTNASNFRVSVDAKTFFQIDATGDISFYEDTGTTAKLFWDASAESLQLKSGSLLELERPDGLISSKIFMQAAASGGLAFDNLNGDGFEFKSAGVDQLVIDSSGNLLVGKTATNFNNAGFQAFADGFVHATGTQAVANSGTIVTLNRKTSDGSIIDFLKDGATVGSIASTDGTDLQIGSGNCYLRFDDATNQILPTNAAGTKRDATLDLGDSDARYKDLYLSGGVVLDDNPTAVGGSVTSKTLDDYEEGTWTPYIVGTTTAGGYSSVVQTGSYTKVGKVVTAAFTFYGASGTGAGSLNITGFPYAVESSGGGPAVTILQYNSGLSLPSGTYVPILFIKPSTTTAEIRCTNSSSGSSFSLMAYPTTADYVRATITYLTA